MISNDNFRILRQKKNLNINSHFAVIANFIPANLLGNVVLLMKYPRFTNHKSLYFEGA